MIMTIKEIDKKINLLFTDFKNFSYSNIFKSPYSFFGDLANFIKSQYLKLTDNDFVEINNIFNSFLLIEYEDWYIENIVYVGFLEILADEEIVFEKLFKFSSGKLKKWMIEFKNSEL